MKMETAEIIYTYTPEHGTITYNNLHPTFSIMQLNSISNETLHALFQALQFQFEICFL